MIFSRMRRLALRTLALLQQRGATTWDRWKIIPRSLALALSDVGTTGALASAAGISYYSILAVFPFLLLLVVLSTSLLSDPALSIKTIAWLSSYLPTGGQILKDSLPVLQKVSGKIGLVSVLSLAWSSMGLFSALRTALDQGAAQPAPKSALLQQWASLLAVVASSVGLLVLIALSTALTLVGRVSLNHISDNLVHLGPIAQQWGELLLRPMALLLQTGTLLIGQLITWIAAVLMLQFLPSKRPGLRHCWLPGFAITLAVEGLRSGLLWSVQSGGNFTVIHGPLSAAIAFMVWAYLTALTFLVGALWSRRLRHEFDIHNRRRPIAQ